MSDFIPGRAIVQSVELISADQTKKQDITSLAIAIEMFEAVTQPFDVAAFSIVDTEQLYTKFPIKGNEFITVTFKAIRPNAKPVTLEFRVHSVQSVTIVAEKKLSTYVLRCVDTDFFYATSKTVNRIYNAPYSSIVSDIVKTYMDREVYIEGTRGTQHLSIPPVNPYRAIDLIRRRAVSELNSKSPFVFFRTMRDKRLWFTTLQNLFRSSSTKTFEKITHQLNDMDSSERVSKNILTYTLPSKFDNTRKLRQGVFAQTNQRFDFVTKKYTIVKTTAAKDLGAADFFSKDMTESEARSFEAFDSTRPETHIQDYKGIHAAYRGMVTDEFLAIEIHGDEEINCGDIITLKLPVQGMDGTIDYTAYSGDYLVTKVKHSILQELNTRFKTELQLIKSVTIDE